jgi:hypothetical protein
LFTNGFGITVGNIRGLATSQLPTATKSMKAAIAEEFFYTLFFLPKSMQTGFLHLLLILKASERQHTLNIAFHGVLSCAFCFTASVRIVPQPLQFVLERRRRPVLHTATTRHYGGAF